MRNESEQLEASDFYASTIEVVTRCMSVVQPYQLGNVAVESLADKEDQSVLTVVDLESEKTAVDYIRSRFPGVRIVAEESGDTGEEGAGDFFFMIDPIDGTRPFTVGAPTSTVICSLHRADDKSFAEVSIGEPATGRLWTAEAASGLVTASANHGYEQRAIRVWDGEIGDNAAVLIDNFQAFAKSGREILRNANIVQLFEEVQSHVAIQNYGSNGLHHALVANGGKRLAGAITTSVGGPWDLGGALHVVNAGGAVETYAIDANRKLQLLDDPLNPFGVDLMISANNSDSLAFLRSALVKSLLQ